MEQQPETTPATSDGTEQAVVPVRPEPSDPRHPGSAYVGAPTAPYLLRAAAGWSWRILIVAAAVYLLLRLVVVLRVAVFGAVAALLLAALLHPVHTGLRKLRLPSGLAALVSVLVLLAAVGLVGTLLGSGIADQFDALRRSVQGGFTQLTSYLEELGVDPSRIQELRSQVTSSLSSRSGALLAGAVSTATIVAEALTGLVLAVFTLFFLLKDGAGIWGWVTRLFSPRLRPQVDEAGRRGWSTLTGYMRGVIVIALLDAAGVAVALLLLGVPLVLPLVLLTFLGGFIPIAGAFLAGFIAVLVALVTTTPLTALAVFGAYIVVQQVEGNLLQPLIMRRAVQLHPLITVLAVTAGATLAGIAGAVVAVPVAALVNTVVGYLAEQRRLVREAEEQITGSGGQARPAHGVLAAQGRGLDGSAEGE